MQKEREAAIQALGLRREVLDKGFVELVDYMGDDDAPVDAARVSFDRRAQEFTDEQNDKLYRYLRDHNHKSPSEMADFKFRVHAPVVTWWQWTRHRMASYNFVSGRYVPFTEDQFYIPTEWLRTQWRKQSESNKQGSDGMIPEGGRRRSNAEYSTHIATKSLELYEWALA